MPRQLFPASRATPMGFGPSAGWAQGLTDVVATDAGLPQSQRVVPDFVTPEGLPVWGSIVDDIWAIEHVDDDAVATVGPNWLDKAEQAWVLRGVQPNVKKSVDGARGEEVQGFYVHPQGHWLGLFLEKRRYLFQATFQVLLQRDVHLAVIERLVGKHGFAHASRPCLRSIFEKTYAWLESCRRGRPSGKRVVLPDGVWEELLVSAILLPFAQFDVSSEWSQRVEATVASMTGLGRSYAVMPTTVVQALARFSSTKGVYTNLSLPWGVNLSHQHTCPLRKVRLPKERVVWKHIGTPWSPSHITLGEADAAVWAAADRLRRKTDDGCRFVHPLDSVALTGALTKGRSSSIALNSRCRKVAAINVSGGHEVFYPWVPSGDNPADEPSRWFERPGHSDPESDEPDAVDGVVDLRSLNFFPKDAMFFIHLCSGARRTHDLLDAVESYSGELGIAIIGIAVDPLANFTSCSDKSLIGKGDLLDYRTGHLLLQLIHSGRVIGGFGSPPCSTISAARHRPLTSGGGPRPLRSRDDPWEPLAYCTKREVLQCQVGTLLFLLTLGLLGEMRMFGAWIGLEHPADRNRQPFASFFNTPEVALFSKIFGLQYHVIHQCMYGANTVKPTGLLLPLGGHTMVRLCNHNYKHALLQGVSPTGEFYTTAAAKYPPGLCHAIARIFGDRLQVSRKHGYVFPFAPKSFVAGEWREPWANVEPVCWKWLEPRPNLFAEYFEAIHGAEVHPSLGPPQQ